MATPPNLADATRQLGNAIAQLDKRDCALLHELTLAAAHKMHEKHHHKAARVMEALEARLDAAGC